MLVELMNLKVSLPKNPAQLGAILNYFLNPGHNQILSGSQFEWNSRDVTWKQLTYLNISVMYFKKKNPSNSPLATAV